MTAQIKPDRLVKKPFLSYIHFSQRRLKKTKWVCSKLLHATWSGHHFCCWLISLRVFTSPIQVVCCCSFLSVSVIPFHFFHFALLDMQGLFLTLPSASFPCSPWIAPSSCWSRCFLLREEDFYVILHYYFVTVLNNILPAYYLPQSFKLFLLFRTYTLHVKYDNSLLLFNNIPF